MFLKGALQAFIIAKNITNTKFLLSMSTESQKSDSASEPEENTLEEYPARPPTPRLGPRASPTRTPASTETEFSSDELVSPPSYRDIDIIEIYQRYQDMYRANYPDVSLINII